VGIPGFNGIFYGPLPVSSLDIKHLKIVNFKILSDTICGHNLMVVFNWQCRRESCVEKINVPTDASMLIASVGQTALRSHTFHPSYRFS